MTNPSRPPPTPTFSSIPLPPIFEYHDFPTPASITPILRYHPSPSDRQLNYDFHCDPSTLTSHPDGLPLPPQALSRPATTPPLPFLRIACPLFLEPVTVFPSLPHLGIIVEDVFVALHRYFTATATFREFQVLTDDAQYRVNAAFQRRVGKIMGGQTQENERLIDVRRVDFLMGRSRFAGLSNASNDAHLFVLNVC